MNTQTRSVGSEIRGALAGVLVTVGLIAAAIIFAPGVFSLEGLRFTPHAPDWSVLPSLAPAVQIHLLAAVIAFGLGVVQLLAPKGTLPHRLLGWVWVIIMFVAAISSLFIRQINHGAFSFIHILSGLTIVALPMAVYAARRHKVAAHARHMRGVFLGALVVAGVLAFLPGRAMWNIFFG